MTRIIAGTARGRRLLVPATGTRPTSDRVREALFSAIDSDLAAAGLAWAHVEVLDLFAGSGALGLEALSRGAAAATFVEKSRTAATIVASNAATLGWPDAQVIVRDAWQVPGLQPPNRGVSLCFVDPPYDWPAADISRLLAALSDAGWLAARARVVVERPAKDAQRPLPDSWPVPRRRVYGDTALWYGQPTPDRVEELEDSP